MREGRETGEVWRGVRLVLVCAALTLGTLFPASAGAGQKGGPALAFFKATTGGYQIGFTAPSGEILLTRPGFGGKLAVRALGSGKRLDLLYAATSARQSRTSSGTRYTLGGRSSWATFRYTLDLTSAVPGLLHLQLSVTPFKDPPAGAGGAPDVAASKGSKLTDYASAPPEAGSSLYLSDGALGSTLLYVSDFTSLGTYFQRTQSSPGQPNFPYPRAGDKGSLLGVSGSSFGYEPPPDSLGNLPHGKATLVLDNYLYLQPGVPADQTQIAGDYLQMLDAVTARLPAPSIPAPDWPSLAAHTAQDLAAPANLVTVNGQTYLRSYVSDTRNAPELITQAAVLAGIKAYEARVHKSVPLDAMLDQNLPSFYDATYHTVVNGLGHDPQARGESWYAVQNLISLLQLAQGGDAEAKQLLLNSADFVVTLAHDNDYAFPQSFFYRDPHGAGSDLEPDVAGGYAWLMLGLHDLTNDPRYLDEAKASIAHLAGRGFDLSYETQMTAYGAAAAERLYTMTGDSAYHGYALLALANLFHAVRLWDCTFGSCRTGRGYHTYMGLNPLPWSDYVAMLEQYQAWLALRDFAAYAQHEAGFVTDLVQRFVTYTPLTLQYSLPPLLPSGAAASAPGEYSFVPHNNLSWYIPLEDLREGDVTSGSIGQEIYGAGGPFVFAAAPQG